ncbi:MAG: GNAT family N-acetyltransferase [Sulfuricurvum sp.]|nr:GNAT family N-acetyltransferase [Sulfuricurvum sp.]
MQQRSRSIPNITIDDVTNSNILEKYIYPNLDINYYWSDDFSPEMYIALAQTGFISVSHEHEGKLLLLPEMQEAYAVLDFKDLHISNKVASLNNRLGYRLEFNTRFDEVLSSIQIAYENCWMVGEYAQLMQTLSKHTYEEFSLFSTELIDNTTGKLIAGEIGYTTRNIYTSLSGFHKPDKRYDNWGTLQLVLLAKHLEEQGVAFWNLGHPYMEYKTDLGANIFSRSDFIKRWRGDNATV